MKNYLLLIGFSLCFLAVGCKAFNGKIDYEKDINKYLKNSQLGISAESTYANRENLEIIFKSNNNFILDPELLLNLSEFLYVKYMSGAKSNSITFHYKRTQSDSLKIELYEAYYESIQTKYSNECYMNTIDYLLSNLSPALFFELEQRIVNNDLYCRIPPKKGFFETLNAIADYRCGTAKKRNIRNIEIYRLHLLRSFYRYHEDEKMASIVDTILLKNEIDIKDMEGERYEVDMTKFVDSLGLVTEFLQDSNLVKRRAKLIEESTENYKKY